MTTNTKQFDKVSKPELEPRHRRAAKQQPEHTPGGSFGPQQAAGNLAVQRMLRGRVLQAKLMVGSPHDPLEDEADRMAEQVVRSSASSASKEAKVTATPDANGSENALLRDREASATAERETKVVPPVINEVLSGDDSQPLDRATRSFMESRFGYDFSRVHVYTGERAAESAQAVNALAYTMGRDVVFGEGQYAPQTSEGKRLLAHELTHVMQQEVGYSPRAVQRQGGESRTTTAPRITMKEFISIVKRIEAANPGKNALEIEQLIARTKYHSEHWDYLLPSLSATSGPQVTAEKGITTKDVKLLSEKLIVTLPGGGEAAPWAPWDLGEADPLHIVVGLVAQVEKQAPGAGGAGGWKGRFVQSLPPDAAQGDVATWLGDVGQAAAEWMTAHPHPHGGETRQDYMNEYAPQSDLLADIDSVAMSSSSGAFVFNPNEPLSANLERFYFPYLSVPYLPREPGRLRRFHIFCDVRGFTLQSDGVTLSPSAIATIDKRVQAFADWFSRNNPSLLAWMVLASKSEPGIFTSFVLEKFTDYKPIPELWIERQNDWQWFAQQFRDFLQSHLKAEGR